MELLIPGDAPVRLRRLRARLIRTLVEAARRYDPPAVGWLAFVALRSEKALFKVALEVLRLALQNETLLQQHRCAGLLGVACYLADAGESVLAPERERLHVLLESMLEAAFKLQDLHTVCVLRDYGQAPLIALGGSSYRDRLVEIFRRERTGRVVRRVFMGEALRLLGEDPGPTAYDPDRIDSSDHLALLWERRLYPEAPALPPLRLQTCSLFAQWPLQAAFIEVLTEQPTRPAKP